MIHLYGIMLFFFFLIILMLTLFHIVILHPVCQVPAISKETLLSYCYGSGSGTWRAQLLCLAQQWWSEIGLLSGGWLNDKWRWILLRQNLTSASVRQFQSRAPSNLQGETLKRRSAATVAPESDVGGWWVDCGLAREGVYWSSEPLPRVSHFLLSYVLSINADKLMLK